MEERRRKLQAAAAARAGSGRSCMHAACAMGDGRYGSAPRARHAPLPARDLTAVAPPRLNHRQAMLLSDPTEKLDPMSLLFYMSSISVGLLLPATAVLEPAAFRQTHALAAARPGFTWWLALNCFMAYAVNLTNFMVTKYTSALTLQVSAPPISGDPRARARLRRWMPPERKRERKGAAAAAPWPRHDWS